ncbi:CopG family transcriptional regulator [Rhodonellum sp.]|uniref:CopG family transcriptional regulator n=1 Tax=Rhodonellum sp. TaxID=2231180 RepID=UPI00271C828F|nr:CopG family transcriptional regulator [Rhodonellum sp.]MDO9553970.1 CopG family transcriptional regulator [Rhodonellum sp.]
MLGEQAKKLSLPKNKLIENALRIYLDHLRRSEYVKSFRQAGEDEDMTLMAKEGIGDYLKQLDDEAR